MTAPDPDGGILGSGVMPPRLLDYVTSALQLDQQRPEHTETFGLWPRPGSMLYLCAIALRSGHEHGTTGLRLTDRDEARWLRARVAEEVADCSAAAVVLDFSWVATVCRDYADELVGEYYQQVSDSGFTPVQAMRLVNMGTAVREVVMGVLRDRQLP